MNRLSIAAALCLAVAANAAAVEPFRALEINPWTGKHRALKNIDPRLLTVASLVVQPGDFKNAIRQNHCVSPATPQVVVRGLRNPDGVAVHPASGAIYVSQNDVLISKLVDGEPVTVIDASTPIYMSAGSVEVRANPLLMPEAIAFSPSGDLYVVEDRPGGRLIRFTLDSSGMGMGGEDVWVPGDWQHFSWEGVAVGPHGELLLSGSSAEDAISGDAPGMFEGVLLYRDRERNWRQLDRRALRSFSQAAFSRDGSKVVYACEVTGEINWMDLSARKLRWGSSMSYAAKTAEGICILPDGHILVAEERGKIFAVDPETDEARLFADAPGTLESLIWDEPSQQLLATEDRNGTILKWRLNPPESASPYAIDRARFEPVHTPRHIPERCPDFLAKVMAFGGVDFRKGGAPVTFRMFAGNVPMVAMDAVTLPIGPTDTALLEDPIVRLQTAVFHPSRMTMPGNAQSGPLAVVIATTRSGKVIKTSSQNVSAVIADFAAPFVQAAGTMRVTVPFPGPVSVSENGICNLHLMGMGKTPDFHIVLNPIDPGASYVMVDDGVNGIQQYQMAGPHGESLAKDMVISFSKELSTQAKWLGRDEKFVGTEPDVQVAHAD